MAGGLSGRGRCGVCVRRGSSRGGARWRLPTAARPAPDRCTQTITPGCAARSRAIERNHTAAPDGYPASGLGALLHLGALAGAGELAGGPRALRYAVGALDQLSRRMRAVATADSANRAEHASDRARRRRDPPPRALRTRRFARTGRRGSRPTSTASRCLTGLGMLALDPDARGGVPPVDSDSYRMIVRDAYLLAGRQLPVDVDGRKQMALRYQRQAGPRRAPASAERAAARAVRARAPHRPTRQPARPPVARLPADVARAATRRGRAARTGRDHRVQTQAREHHTRCRPTVTRVGQCATVSGVPDAGSSFHFGLRQRVMRCDPDARFARARRRRATGGRERG